MKLLLTIITLSIFSPMAFSQEKDIDLQMNKCINTSIANSEKRKCIETTEANWDTLMNKHYQSLMNILPKEAKNKLRESQRNWIKYRDTESQFINEYYLNYKQGSLFLLISDNKRLEIIKKRALELEEYHDYLEK